MMCCYLDPRLETGESLQDHCLVFVNPREINNFKVNGTKDCNRGLKRLGQLATPNLCRVMRVQEYSACKICGKKTLIKNNKLIDTYCGTSSLSVG